MVLVEWHPQKWINPYPPRTIIAVVIRLMQHSEQPKCRERWWKRHYVKGFRENEVEGRSNWGAKIRGLVDPPLFLHLLLDISYRCVQTHCWKSSRWVETYSISGFILNAFSCIFRNLLNVSITSLTILDIHHPYSQIFPSVEGNVISTVRFF